MSCQILMVQAQLTYLEHQIYNFIQLCYLYLCVFNKRIQEELPEL